MSAAKKAEEVAAKSAPSTLAVVRQLIATIGLQVGCVREEIADAVDISDQGKARLNDELRNVRYHAEQLALLAVGIEQWVIPGSLRLNPALLAEAEKARL